MNKKYFEEYNDLISFASTEDELASSYGIVQRDVLSSTTWVTPELDNAITIPRSSLMNQQEIGPAFPAPAPVKLQHRRNSSDYNEMFRHIQQDQIKDDFSEGKPCERTKKRDFCCIPRKKIHRKICIFWTLFTITILIILGILFYPRFPEMKVTSLTLANGVNSFKFFGPYDGKVNNFTVQLDMIMTVQVSNTNYYHMKVDSIEVEAFISANISEINKGPGAGIIVPGETARRVFRQSDSTVKIGKATHGPVSFPSKQNVVFTMNFTVIYTPDQTRELKDDVIFNEISQSCSLIDPGNRTMSVK